MYLQHEHEAWTCSIGIRNEHAKWTCMMEKQHGHEVMDMQHGQAARTCSMNMKQNSLLNYIAANQNSLLNYCT
jgi:hypothetical protein